MNIIPCNDPTRTLLVLQQLCLNEFKLNLYQKEKKHYYDGNLTGSFWSVLMWMEKGEIELITDFETHVLKEGDFYYIPQGSRFIERAKQVPTRYYILAFAFKPLNDTHFDIKFDISKINSLSPEWCKEYFERTYDNFLSDDDADNLQAIADFYSLLVKIVPELDRKKQQTLSPVLEKATQFIYEHLTEDFSMEELAAACFISQSRLFHLFSKELKVTPVNYKNRMRVKKSFKLLTETSYGIEEIAEKLNFKSSAHYRKEFRKNTGVTPTKYRKMFNNSLKK